MYAYNLALTLILAGLSSQVVAVEDDKSSDFTDYSIFELLQMEVSIVSATRDTVFESAAAVTLITADQIRRSGYTSMPDLFRDIPGFHVAKINDHKWSVSPRGFGGLRSAKLLVLMDGRSLYSSVFGGVFWDMQSIALADIERIEIIRGPGASVWGSNSVNGVVNIITKKPDMDAQSQTRHYLAGYLNNNRSTAFSYRASGQTESQLAYRFSAYHKDIDEQQEFSHHAEHASNSRRKELNLALNWAGESSASHDLHIGALDGEQAHFAELPTASAPFVTEGKLPRTLSTQFLNYHYIREKTEDKFQSFRIILDRYERIRVDDGSGFEISTAEGEYRQGVKLSGHDINWGMNYRHQHYHYFSNFTVALEPDRDTEHITSGFIQNEMTFAQDKGELSLGLKYENTHDTKDNWQPSARLGYSSDSDTFWWGAISKAYRAPAVADQGFILNFAVFPGQQGQLTMLQLLGNQQKQSEKLLSWELGVRHQYNKQASLDLSVFHHDYDRLTTTEPAEPYCYYSQTILPCQRTDIVVLPNRFDNQMDGHSNGMELVFKYRLDDTLSLTSSVSLLNQHYQLSKNSHDVDAPAVLSSSVPKRMFKTRLDWDIGDNIEVTAMANYNSSLRSRHAGSFYDIKSNWRVDVKVAWLFDDNREVYLRGENMLDSHHVEYTANDGTPPTEIGHQLAFGFLWQF